MPEFLTEAIRLGVACELADARDWDGYDRFGLVYLNHPLVCGPNCKDEAVLENWVHGQMSSGSVLLAVNYDLAPGCPAHGSLSPCNDDCPGTASWHEITRTGQWAAAWVKP
jgi:hypothetical protein